MKNTVLAIMLLLSGLLSAQQEVLLTMSYNSDTTYQQELEQSSTITMKYSGPKDYIDALQASGMQNPDVKTSGYKLQSLIHTGKADATNTIPMTIKLKVVAGTMSLPDDTVIHGHLKKGQMPIIDSIASEDMDENVRKGMLGTMRSMFSQVDFADQAVKVGGQYKKVTPISLPMPNGITLDMDITTIYKLVDVTNGMANFIIDQDFKMKTDVSEFTTKASGTGHGKMQYDTVNKYNTSYEITLNMQGKVFIENMKVETDTVMKMNQTMKIVAD